MTAAKIIRMIALVGIGGIVLFIFSLYFTIKTKTRSINKYQPFSEWVGETVTLDIETVIFEEKVKMNSNRKYPYTLLDSLHPNWQYRLDQERLGDVTRIRVFPPGTKLKLEKAIQYTNGVSGSSYPTIFGTITAGEDEYKIGYQWGEVDLSKGFDIEERWRFHKAPWQAEPDTAYHAIPNAHF